jgi:DNA polymerase III gamma/tau subunit
MLQRMITICDKEGVKWEATALASIAQASAGDMRRAINLLQYLAPQGITDKVTSIFTVQEATMSKLVSATLGNNPQQALTILAELWEHETFNIYMALPYFEKVIISRGLWARIPTLAFYARQLGGNLDRLQAEAMILDLATGRVPSA